VVLQQGRRSVEVVDHQIKVAIVVKVCSYEAVGEARLVESPIFLNLGKVQVSVVAEGEVAYRMTGQGSVIPVFGVVEETAVGKGGVGVVIV